MFRFRGSRRSFHQFKDPPGTGKCILQFRDNAGDFIKGFCILIGIAQKARQITHGDAAANGDEGTCEANTCVGNGIDEPCAGINQRGEEYGPKRSLLKPAVDFIKLLHRGIFMSKGPDHLDISDGLVNEPGLLAPCHGLQAEHGIGPCSDKIRNHNR